MKDLHNRLVLVQAQKPILVLDATVPAAAVVDLAGWNSAAIEFNAGTKGAGDTGTITLQLEHAPDDGTGSAGAYANVVAADMLGVVPAAGIIYTLAGGAVAAKIYQCGYVGDKRFLRFTLAENNGNATGTILAITLIKGHGIDKPAIA